MRNNVERSSFHDAQGKPTNGSRGVVHRIGVAVLSISALAAGAIHMISGSPNKPKNIADVGETLVEELEAIINPRKADAKEYLASEQAINSPAVRVDKILSELTSTLADLTTSYDDYVKAVEANDGSSADKEQRLRGAVIKTALATLNGANMPDNERAPLVLAGCENCIEELERLRPMLPEICAAEIADLSPERTAIEKLREKTKGFSQLPDMSEKVGMLDTDGGESAGLIKDDFLKAQSQKKSDTDTLLSADLSPVGGG
jgi:hypothetical protein